MEPDRSAYARHANAAAGQQILEASEDGAAIVGRARPVPPQSSARLVFDAELLDSSGARKPLPITGGLQDARFAPPPSKLVALLDQRDALWLWDRGSGQAAVIEQEAFPGFAFSHDARLIAYARGSGPELDAWLRELETGATRALTNEGAPVWGFAFSPDDRRLVFVDSREGFPCLMTIALDGTGLARLTNRGLTAERLSAGAQLAPFPDGRRPPIWSNRGVFVEAQSGVHAFDLQGNSLLARPGARDLHTVSGSVLFRSGDSWEAVP